MNKIHLKVEPYPYQREGITYGLEKKRLIIGDEPGLGKCQSLDSIIKTPVGDVKMGDLKIGSELFGQDGNIYHVTGIYPQGCKKVYKISFSDGSHTECTLDHLWNVRDENRRRRGTGWVTKTLDDILKIGLYNKSSLKRKLSRRRAVPKWEIPICMPLQYPSKEYKIDPYLMGAYLGDGTISGSYLSFSFPPEKSIIADRIKDIIPSTMEDHVKIYNGIYRHVIVNGGKDKYHTRNYLSNEIKSLGLNVNSKEKFIPEIYFYGDAEQRISLLKGMMDTDGSCIKNRTIFHTTSKFLAYDIRRLVQSLGGIAIVKEYDRTHEHKGIEYQVNIRTDFCPFSSSIYKASSWKPNKAFRVTRYMVSVEYVGEKECQCIKVSSPDELYLTDEFIVTHNTLQSIGVIDTADAYPCLVICPSSLKINWKREFEKFTERKALVLENQVNTTWPYLLSMNMFQVAITNYESLRKYFVWDIRTRGKNFRLKDVVFCPQIKMFKSVIIDESHRVKDPGAQQTIFTKGISVGKKYVILLSGTPVVNRPEDLISQLSIMGRLQEFGGRTQFVANYCAERGKEPAVPLSELSRQLYQNCMIRREKAKVLPQLPAKTRIDLYINISNEKEYGLAAYDLAEYLRQYKACGDAEVRRKMRMKALVQFMTLRQLATLGKIAQAVDFIHTYVDNGNKLIVFCSLHEVVDALLKHFPGAVTVTGRDSAVSKQAAVDAFQQNDRVKLIICSIKAAGVGLTLTASSTVAFVELPWTFADCQQCEDRAHRIGQKDNVTCYYLLGQGTIDTTIYALINKKKSIASEIMNSDDEIPTDEMYFNELVDKFLQNDGSMQNRH